MVYIKWFLPAVISFLMGLSLVKYLTVHPVRMSLYLFISCSLLFILIIILARFFDGYRLLISMVLNLILFMAGYAIMTHRFLSRDDPRPVSEITRAKGDPGKGHTAVIYFTHGEPETYDSIGWINQFREFDEQGIKFVPFPARPFFTYILRHKYLKVGKSDHRGMHKKMLSSLEEMFRDAGDEDTRFYI
jgi:hypothetical protein